MKRLLLCLSLIVLGCAPLCARAGDVVVAAAASLTDALTEISRAYESSSQGRILISFGASSTLARQIQEGAPIDLFFSADTEKMEMLERDGLIDSPSRTDLLSNRLVLVVPADSTLAIGSPEDLTGHDVKRIALAEPSTVPAGIYAKKYLLGKRLWDGIQGKIVPVRDVRAALVSVEWGNVDVGFVYRTDAVVSKGVRIAYEVPLDEGPRIVYPVAMAKGARRKEAPREFFRFVVSDAGKAIFEKYGFVLLP